MAEWSATGTFRLSKSCLSRLNFLTATHRGPETACSWRVDLGEKLPTLMAAVIHWVSSSLGRAIDLRGRMVAAALAPIQHVLYDDYVFLVGRVARAIVLQSNVGQLSD